MQVAIDDPATYKYCLKSQTMPLLESAVAWYKSTYGVALDPGSEALSLVGSQEGLAHLLMAVADEGQGLLMADVAYPSYFGAAHVAGLQPVFIPSDPETFLPQLERVPAEAVARCRACLLNFPNNPTSATADLDFWRRALQWAEVRAPSTLQGTWGCRNALACGGIETLLWPHSPTPPRFPSACRRTTCCSFMTTPMWGRITPARPRPPRWRCPAPRTA